MLASPLRLGARHAVRAIAILLLLCVAGLPARASDSFQIVRTLIESGHFEEARAVVSQLSQDPRIGALNDQFVRALVHKHQGEFAEAAQLMRSILAEDPGFARVRQELAHTLYLMGERQASRHHFAFLSRTVDSDAHAALYDRYLMAIRLQRPWTLQGSIGVAPSTNINDGTRGDIVYVGGIPFRTENRARSGVGLSYDVAGTYRFDLADQYALTVGASIAGNSYRDSRFDRMHAEAFVQGSRRFDRWHLSAGLAADRAITGWRGYRWGIGPYVAARRDFGRLGVFATRASWTRRGYDRNAGFDGWEADLALQYRYAFSPRLSMTGGLAARMVRTRHDFHDYAALRPRLAVEHAVNRHLVMHAALAYERRFYRGSFPLTGTPRRDHRVDVELAATFPRLSFGDFAPRISYGFHETRSNVDIYSRRRHSVGISLTRTY